MDGILGWLAAMRGAPRREGHGARRREMVERQIVARGVRDPRVLEALRRVPRHLFVPQAEREQAYADGPIPIGHDQTISQPYIVALMTEALRPAASMRVLEVGTGSGYQTAVLAECVARVYTVEIVADLGRRAGDLLRELGYRNVRARVGDGSDGWSEHAPFDGILVTAAPPRVPEPLIEQLVVGGRLVLPVGRDHQELLEIERTAEGSRRRSVAAVRFVPMTGGAAAPR